MSDSSYRDFAFFFFSRTAATSSKDAFGASPIFRASGSCASPAAMNRPTDAGSFSFKRSI